MTKTEMLEILRGKVLTESPEEIQSRLNEIADELEQSERVVYGHWIKNNDRAGWNCSFCHMDDCYAYLYNYDMDLEGIQDYYCPNCGARMIEVSE